MPNRILFLSANPIDQEPLKLYREFESIGDRLYSSTYRNEFEIIPRFSASIDKLHEYILRFKPTIVHFSGHLASKPQIYTIMGL